MSGYRGHSLILAAEFPVDDADEMRRLLRNRESQLAEIDAHHIVVYTSMWGRRRVLVTVGIRNPESIRDVLRSPAVFDLFDIAGSDGIPAIFAGRIVEKIDLGELARYDGVPGVVVGIVTRVDDVRRLVETVYGAADRFHRAGVRKVWVYEACDDSREAMILQEIDDEVSARRWLNRPDAAAEWMTNAGFGVHPTVFVGRLDHVMAVRERMVG
ncbi:fatty-acid--CoA ligase [Mycolicibacterium arenosum]|uniref:Fatty-acid--CoA ligase n=1 Tax=Mycolicibacterium arenosum TaxID=2952157 RepID=A0ABT1M7J5_9MYCO|nr:fatty-acid--CoA ligase [Mycolicibacterium sp. CAU 1645]MCP9275098.1 fatty-acid--CoA ligase [Mycolicibacterium sp. CAU 1645]